MRATALILDAAVVLIFTGLGRNTHDESAGALALLSTAWPFLIGLAVSWAVLRGLQQTERFRDLKPTSLQVGVGVWISTVCLGMLLRTLSGAGTAVPFVTVAFVVLGLGFIGWRACYLTYSHLRAKEDPAVSPKL